MCENITTFFQCFHKTTFPHPCVKLLHFPFSSCFRYTNSMKKKQPQTLSERWLNCTIIVFGIIFLLYLALRIKQDFNYAAGNEYAAQHIAEHLLYSFRSAFGFAGAITLTLGQVFFWAIEGIQKAAKKDNSKRLSAPALAVIIVVLILATIILTAPLWFRIPV